MAVAELAFALMIAVPNRLIEAHNAHEAEGKFLKKELKRTELIGKTLGLVGIGHIAPEVAQARARLRHEGDRLRPLRQEHDAGELVPTLEELFQQADYISLHTPLTDETRGMINTETHRQR